MPNLRFQQGTFMKPFIALFIMLFLLSGCDAFDSMSEGYKHTQEIGADIEKAIGSKPYVSFNWHNGSLTNVSVTFEGVPEGVSVSEIVTLARNSVASHFKQEPEQVDVRFTFSDTE